MIKTTTNMVLDQAASVAALSALYWAVAVIVKASSSAILAAVLFKSSAILGAV